MKPIHIWLVGCAQTRCGLWFKAIESHRKPNVISTRLALELNDATGHPCRHLCKRCVASARSWNKNLFKGGIR